MLYLKRKIDAFLAEWKANPDRKPLIVKGPRSEQYAFVDGASFTFSTDKKSSSVRITF